MGTHREATVTAGKFGVSVDTGAPSDGATLHVYRFIGPNGTKMMKGEGHGRHFETSDAAWAWAKEHGLLEVYRARTWCRKHRCLHTNYGGKPSPTFGKCFR